MARPDAETGDDDDAYRCPVCGREFATADDLEEHVRSKGLLW